MSDLVAIDRLLCRVLAKRPGESLRDAAARIMAAPHGDRRWRVAREVLHGRGQPWAIMRRAAKAARRSGCVS